MKLLGRADSLNVRKVLWAIDEMGIDIPREDYGGSFGKTDSPEYRQWNPPALVPTLIDGETAVWESNTIIRYLGSKNPDNGFFGHSPAAAASASQWMDWQLGTLNPLLQTIFAQSRLGDKRDQKVLDENQRAVEKHFNTVLTNSLTEKDFILGARVTAADICLGVMLHRYVSLLGTNSLQARVKQYHEKLAERPGFKTRVAIGKP